MRVRAVQIELSIDAGKLSNKRQQCIIQQAWGRAHEKFMLCQAIFQPLNKRFTVKPL